MAHGGERKAGPNHVRRAARRACTHDDHGMALRAVRILSGTTSVRRIAPLSTKRERSVPQAVACPLPICLFCFGPVKSGRHFGPGRALPHPCLSGQGRNDHPLPGSVGGRR